MQVLNRIAQRLPTRKISFSGEFLEVLRPRRQIVNLGVTFEVEDLVPYHVDQLADEHFASLSRLSDEKHLRETIRRILIPRVVGSEGHRQVQRFIRDSLRDANWTVEEHKFAQTVPILGHLQFNNIVAKLNPHAERYLVLACHYDSKYMADFEFLGATDSAVPCAMLINMAHLLRRELRPYSSTKLSLMFVFFDGEEAFEQWTAEDSIYGARALARKWEAEGFLDRLDMLVLLDLLGAPDPNFYSFFSNTESWYTHLVALEERLDEAGHLQRYQNSGVSKAKTHRYFHPNTLRSSGIEDDHIPFLRRNVPVLHVIPVPFPKVWHTKDDDESVIDYATTENLARILRLFAMEYLLGQGDK